MELFLGAKAVRLRGGDGWYLHASEGEVPVTSNRSGLDQNGRWSVEVVDADNIRLRSCYGKYLSGLPDVVFLSLPEDLSPSANWEPIREGYNNLLVRLKTSGGYLLIDRGTGSLPSGHNTRPVYLIRNPNRNRAPKDGTLWEVDVVEWIGSASPYSELPECPYCPSLEKLSLQQNYDLMVIPSSFFLCMPALKVLNLSYTSIKCLPKSISKLVNLEEFFLRGCHLLMELPIEIGELEKLEFFDIEGTPLSYLPEEIGKIDQLRSLKVTLNARANLIRKSKDVSRIVPMKYLSERTQFKELSIDVHPDGNWWDIEVTSILSELASFKCLNTLKLYLPNVEALKHIRWYGTTLIHPALECFRIIVGHYCFLSRIPHELEVEFNNLEKFEKGLKCMNGKGIMPEISKLLKRVNAVALERHWVLKNLSELGLRNMSNLKFCCLAECKELQTIIDSEQICQVDLEKDDSNKSESRSESECEEESVLSSLQYLSIHYMEKLESICRGRVSKTCLSSLKSMALHTCLSLTTIFTKEILDNLKNLKELIVEDCPEISSLVSLECSNSTSDEYLPSLKKISLLELPKLVNISNGLCIAPRLESMVIFYCPELNKLSSTDVSSRNLDVFKGEEEWWNALEWNEQDTDHKNYLTDKFTPLSRDTDFMADLAKIRLTTTL